MPTINVGRKSLRADANARLAIARLKTKEITDKLTSFAASNTDIGKVISISVPDSNVHIMPIVFEVGDTIKFFNNTDTRITITSNSGVTIYLPNSANTFAVAETGNRYLGPRGFVTLTTVAANTFIVSGIGVS